MSLRRAGKLISVSHTWVDDARKWLDGGGDPAALPDVQEGTLEGIRSWLAFESDVEVRRAALQLAADRLQQVVAELREEAKRPDAGALATPTRSGDDGRIKRLEGVRDTIGPRRKTKRAAPEKPKAE